MPIQPTTTRTRINPSSPHNPAKQARPAKFGCSRDSVQFGMSSQQPSSSSKGAELPLHEDSVSDTFDIHEHRSQSTTPNPDAPSLSRSASLQSNLSELASSPEPKKQWSYPQRVAGAIKGAFKQAYHDFFANFKQNILISCVITLATCWAPGSQLVLIPFYFCIDSALSAVRGAQQGWEDPDRYSSQASEMGAKKNTTRTIPVPVSIT